MGRFYESTAARYVDDKMFQAPHQLMAQAIQSKDSMIDKQIDIAEAYDKLLKIQALDVDNPRAQEKLKEYHSKIDGVVGNISKNPLNYANYSRDIRELGREIDADWTSGEAYNMQNNKARYDAENAKLDELRKTKPEMYSAEMVAREKAAILAKYIEKGGAKWDKNLGKATNSLDIQSTYYGMNFDIEKTLDRVLKANGVAMQTDTKGGMYFHKVGNTSEAVTEGQVAEMMQKQFMADSDLQATVNRYGELGMEDYVGADINKAVNWQTTKGKDGEEYYTQDEYKNRIVKGYSDDWFGKNIAAVASAKKYSNTGHTEDWSVNSEAQRQAVIEAEKADTVALEFATTGTLTSATGGTGSGFIGIQNDYAKKINRIKGEMHQTIVNTFRDNQGKNLYKDINDLMIKSPAMYTRIIKGDFSDLPKNNDTKMLIAGYRETQLTKLAQNARIEDFHKRYPKEEAVQSNPKWQKFLGENDAITTNKKYTWNLYPEVSAKQREAYNKDFEANYATTTPIAFKEGEKLGKHYIVKKGGERLSIRDMLDKGLIEPIKVKSPTGTQTISDVEVTSYKIVGTNEMINYKSGSSIVPDTDFSQDNPKGINFRFNVNVGGVEHSGTTNQISSPELKRYANKNSQELMAKLFLQTSNVGNLPLGNGVIYHGRDSDENDSTVFKKGTVSIPGHGDVNITNPGMGKILGELIYPIN